MGERVGHVVGQDQEAFDQARQQHDDHREGDVGDQRPPNRPADGHQAREGENRRDRGRKDRRGHAACGVFRGRHRVLAQAAVSVIGVFPHDDGVVHHDPQRDDQREKRDHVDRETRGIHQRDGRDQRHGNARRDPEGGARVEEQEQQPTTSARPSSALSRRMFRRPEIASARVRIRSMDVPFRQARFSSAATAFDLPLDGDGVAVLGPVHADRDGRVLAHEIGALPVGSANDDPGHVADGQRRSVVVGPQRQRRDPLGAAVAAPVRTRAPARRSPRGGGVGGGAMTAAISAMDMS
jgi:hypothetical protein